MKGRGHSKNHKNGSVWEKFKGIRTEGKSNERQCCGEKWLAKEIEISKDDDHGKNGKGKPNNALFYKNFQCIAKSIFRNIRKLK